MNKSDLTNNVSVRLFLGENEKLVSRAQAKRMVIQFGFERFRLIILDFYGVSEIGSEFSDQVFRVFQSYHPDLILEPINMTDLVEKTVNLSKVTSRMLTQSEIEDLRRDMQETSVRVKGLLKAYEQKLLIDTR